jgi:hypothetical protein
LKDGRGSCEWLLQVALNHWNDDGLCPLKTRWTAERVLSGARRCLETGRYLSAAAIIAAEFSATIAPTHAPRIKRRRCCPSASEESRLNHFLFETIEHFAKLS